MDQPALQSRPSLTLPRRGLYNGAETDLDFGDPAQEFGALTWGCGVFDLSWRTKITVAGKDRVRWLHNMVTNDVRGLPSNRGAYNFVLNAQGRIQGDLYIFNRGESFTIDTDRAHADTLLGAMKRFIIMDKVEMTTSEDTVAVGLCGRQAEKVLAEAGFDGRELQPLELRDLGDAQGMATLVRGPENKPGWFEVWTNARASHDVRTKLMQCGAQPVGAQAVEMWRIVHGIPHYRQDIRDRDLPQETGQMQALCFTKGCYIGQEIVERIRSRGQVHRTFTGFEFEEGLPSPGKYESEGGAPAEVTSVASVPTVSGDSNIGLGYVRREVAAAGRVDLPGLKARIVSLPFAIQLKH